MNFLVTAIGLKSLPFGRQLKGLDKKESLLREFANELTLLAKSYPPQVSSKPARWVSEKQRRFVMMAIRTGLIHVPYRRTRQLANSWRNSVTHEGRDDIARVWNTNDYAPYVQGRRQSQDMRERNWQTIIQLANRLWPKYRGRIIGAVTGKTF